MIEIIEEEVHSGKEILSLEKPCSKEALRVLSKKEIQLKELLLQVIMATQAKDKEVVRVLAFLIGQFKSIKNRR